MSAVRIRVDVNGRSSLIHSIINESPRDEVEALLSKHPELLNYPDANGKTPLFWAIQQGEIEAFDVLMERADIDVTRADYSVRDTPLMQAAFAGSDYMAKKLLAKMTQRADLICKNQLGQTAIDKAKQSGFHDIAYLIQERISELLLQELQAAEQQIALLSSVQSLSVSGLLRFGLLAEAGSDRVSANQSQVCNYSLKP